MKWHNSDYDNGNLQIPFAKMADGISDHSNYLSADKIVLPPVLNKEDSIEILELPLRLENALKNSDISTVGQFYSISNHELFHIRNIGYKSVRFLTEVKQLISGKLGCIPENQSAELPRQQFPEVPAIPVNKLISHLIERCGNDRAKELIKRRYGLMNGERQTLEEIGESYRVTRERIRQIQEKSLKRMRHPATTVKKPLTGLIEDIILRNGGIISADEADVEVPKALGGVIEDGSSLLDLLCDLGWIQTCRIGDIPIYSLKLDGVSLLKLTERIILLIKKEDLGLDVDSIIRKNSMFRKIKDERFNPTHFVLRYCRTDPRLEEISVNSEVIFRHYTSGHFATKSWVALMRRVLEEQQMPLHFTEITDKVNDLLSGSERQLDVRRAHSILIEDKAFAHSGVNGTYGLTSWGLRKELIPELIEECLKKAGFPLHWKQIFNYVSKYKNTRSANITSCLENNRSFKRVSSGIYWFSEKGR